MVGRKQQSEHQQGPQNQDHLPWIVSMKFIKIINERASEFILDLTDNEQWNSGYMLPVYIESATILGFGTK